MSDDREQIGRLMRMFYEDVSGPAGGARHARSDEIFHPAARLMRTGVDEAGRAWIKVMTPAEYVVDTTPFFTANAFYETELSSHVERFGNIAWARSVYEARHHPDDAKPVKRGVNTVQFFHDGTRWQVVSVLWDNERSGLELPDAWLSA